MVTTRNFKGNQGGGGGQRNNFNGGGNFGGFKNKKFKKEIAVFF